MSASKAGEDIEGIISNKTNDFAKSVEASQKTAYNKILALLKDIETDKNGNIKRTVKNIKSIRKIGSELRNTVVSDAYKKKVESYLNAFDDINSIQSAYYASEFTTFSKNKAIYDLIKQESINNTKSLLVEGGIDAAFNEPIKDLLTNNIMSGAKYADMVEEVKNFILGNEKLDGRLLAYTKQITSDALHVYSGVYNEAISDDLGLEYIRYTGSVKDTTREFCQQRAGKYYHKKEVEKWASLNWKGKYRGTTASNIFQYVGGYNCRHIIIYVSEAVVPKAVIERNK